MKIAPKNWRDFQHYKDRNPPWIRLHKGLLDNYEFQCLPVASRALAPMLWLLASDHIDGIIDADVKRLAFRLRMDAAELSQALKPLIDAGFFEVVESASGALAGCLQPAVPETEALQRTEAEAETEAGSKPRASRSAPLSRPDDVSPQVWADWCQLRKAKKATVSETVLKEARAESIKAGLTLERYLTIWCARGSQGLQADWLKPHERASPQRQTPADANAEAKRLLGFTDDEVIDA